MTISPLDVRLGSQVPKWLTVPPAVGSAGEEAADLAASAGLVLDPWERLVLVHSLGERERSRSPQWSALEVGLIVPRQNGKGAVLEARELAGLFLFRESLILHSAHEFKTAQEAFLRIRNLIESTRDLERKVLRIRTASGQEGIELVGGQRLRFVARSGGSGRGFTGDLVIFDEAFEMSPQMTEALLPTLSARRNPQVWYTSSAPLPEAKSDVLRALCKRGRAGASPRLAYFEWCVDDGADLDDPEMWAEANPGLGLRVSEEFIRDVERVSMSVDGFARERLGIWHENETESVIPEDVWASAADPRSRLTDPVCFAVDVNPERSASAVAVAGLRQDGLLHGEIVQAGPGTDWVVTRMSSLVRKWRNVAVVLDGKAAAGALIDPLKKALKKAEVPVTAVGVGEVVQACGEFYDDVMAHDNEDRPQPRFRHLDQPELNAALFGARKREVGDAWAWHRKHSSVNIAPLVAVTLARWGFLRYRRRAPRIHTLTKEVTDT